MADQAKLKKRLDAILKLPENQICADCKKRGPRWASANLGIFICIECSGIHRNLGVHISFVRSVNLDSWTVKQVEFMEEWGNGRANEYYEANISPHVARPKEGDSVRVVEKFIRDKYEFKRYIGKTIPEKTVVHESSPRVQPENERPHENHNTKKVTDSHHHNHQISAPVAPAAIVPSRSAPSESLIDFLDDPLPAPVTQTAATITTTTHAADEFGGFSDSNTTYHAANTTTLASNGFGNAQETDFLSFTPSVPNTVPAYHPAPSVPNSAPAYPSEAFYPTGTAPPTQQPYQQQQQQRPQSSADAILSLYNASNNAGPGPGGLQSRGGPPHMGMHGHMAGPMMHFGGQPQQQQPMHYPQQQQQQQQPMHYPPPQQHQAMQYPPQQPPSYFNGATAPVNPFQQQQMAAMMQHGHQPQQQQPPYLPPAQYLPSPQQQQGYGMKMPSYGPPPVPPVNPFPSAMQWPGRS
mmetsp:Transcript_10552/g.14564  ORF Transcript_10552/g.14564 Transcript_10552/m.14564 type:complete len:466 (+) Transcript_10552:42-1439(+)|eukprot:CAMPEP_0170073556 /NCGR_PEP_ID=MMETSP0019_2-20121128/10950_1 /TAXON_ID=98059 /ORGANISM="Dinobryon sp., Strain UTEXLB2267" /LENGTH=465 /DNA_ID=CAMNT_0010283157 /DNA_START=17 /DNA_END=1414 /DNA_ORIENTATION=+